MLIIRFQRTGRRNSPFYRVVLQNKRDAIGSKALKILGSYNPHTKDAVLKKDEILKYITNGAQVSNSIAKLLIANDVKHKRIVFVSKTEKAPKKKAQESANKNAELQIDKEVDSAESDSAQAEAPKGEDQALTDEPVVAETEDTSKEEMPAEAKAPEENQENNKEN